MSATILLYLYRQSWRPFPEMSGSPPLLVVAERENPLIRYIPVCTRTLPAAGNPSLWSGLELVVWSHCRRPIFLFYYRLYKNGDAPKMVVLQTNISYNDICVSTTEPPRAPMFKTRFLHNEGGVRYLPTSNGRCLLLYAVGKLSMTWLQHKVAFWVIDNNFFFLR